MQTRSKNNISKILTKKSFTAITTKNLPIDPTTYTQAMCDDLWRSGMSEDFNAILQNNTFELVPPAEHQNIVGTKWIFKLKYLPNGSIDRYMARFVAQGFHQQYGLDYSETFRPVIRTTTIRLIPDIAVSRSWCIRQLDVNNAFLQRTLTEEVYIKQLPGFVDKDRPHHICRLKKALYDLKQAPCAWYQELKSYLLAAGFINSITDTSLFIYHKGCDFFYTLVYVDDIIVTRTSPALVDSFISSLADRFSLKDQGDLHYFLGIEATRTNAGLHLM